MGIDLRVESESGEVQDELLDDNNLTEKLLPEFQLPIKDLFSAAPSPLL